MKNLKYFKICFLFALVAMLQIKVVNAQNLVPNPSFEDSSSCPSTSDELYLTEWTININSAEFFHACANENPNSIGVPVNYNGFQYPDDTNCSGYCGLFSYTYQVENHREYFGTELISTLVVGQKYYVSFKISLADDYKYAINNIGLLFTNTYFEEINSNNPFLSIWPAPFLNNFAHVFSEEIVTDKEMWATIRGSFIADSAYHQLIIGNFFTDENTDVIQVDDGEFNAAYYYIDDVCVSTDSTYSWDYSENCNQSIIKDSELPQKIIVFPNPATDYITIIITFVDKQTTIELFDAQNNNITNKISIINQFNSSYILKRNDLPSGIYFLRIKTNNNSYISKLVLTN